MQTLLTKSGKIGIALLALVILFTFGFGLIKAILYIGFFAALMYGLWRVWVEVNKRN